MIADLLVVGWLVVAAASAYALKQHLALMEQRGRPHSRRRALVIVPVKGIGPVTGPFLERLLAQDHPAYRVLFVVESRSDAAYGLLAGLRGRAHPRTEVAIAGESIGCSQKVWNQLAGLEHLTHEEQLVVFADADILPPSDWLSVLDWGVVDERQPLLTGSRLIVPGEANLASYAMASITLSMAGAARPSGLTLAWGGTMAMTPETILRIDLRRRWQSAMSDDGELTNAARDKGLAVATQRCLLLESPWSGGFREAIALGRRHFMVMHRYRPATFWLGILAVALPIGGAIAAVQGALHGNRWHLGALVLASILAGLRGGMRKAVVRRVVSSERFEVQRRWLRFDSFARPLWWSLMLVMMLAALVGSRMRWGGVAYGWTAHRGARVTDRRGD